MTNRIRILVSLAAVVAALVVFGPSASAAPNINCVTGPEFRAIAHGMDRRHVQDVLDGPGVRGPLNTSARTIERQYPVCGQPWHHARVYVFYNRKTDRMGTALRVVSLRGTLERDGVGADDATSGRVSSDVGRVVRRG